MIFSSPLWQKVLDGTKQVTSRAIKPTTKCTCGHLFDVHIWDRDTYVCQEVVGHFDAQHAMRCSCEHFFPTPYAIGKLLCIQTKRGQPALCKCGKTEKEHDVIPITLHDTPAIKYAEEIRRQNVKPCKNLGELQMEKYITGNAYSTVFKPVKLRITGGCWRDEWLKNLKESVATNRFFDLEAVRKLPNFDQYLPMRPLTEDEYKKRVLEPRARWGQRISNEIKEDEPKLRDDVNVLLQAEATREGFEGNWQALQDRLKELNPKQYPLWRISFELVR